MYYMINGKFINESGSLSCCVPQKNGKLPGLVKNKTKPNHSIWHGSNCKPKSVLLKKKTKSKFNSFFPPDECCVCLSNGDIILPFTLTMHIQLQNNCTYERYCDDKISDMYPNTYELQVIKKKKERKRKPTLKILTQEIFFTSLSGTSGA